MRALSISLGCGWAGALLLIGLWLWDMPIADIGRSDLRVGRLVRCASVCVIAASQIVFMVWVADAVFPKAPQAMTWSLKLVAMAVFWLSLIVGLLYGWELTH